MANRLPAVDGTNRSGVDPYASLILGHDIAPAIDGCEFLVVSDSRLAMLSPPLRRAVETEFVTRSAPTAGIRVLERR